ncbi:MULTISPECIES: M16 family metallopeptidase [Rhodanobacter]|uniref:M16 family metallopeptidase n=1 Tax=Rhodanobacter TaxID=75309 RepID=UPI00040CEF1E|nr:MULTISPECIES: pitrilysin family protein [Rhodanobacter]TAN19547.1 MAG: insulinase family protein [Rhodanobacter sp.]UJJ54962.1 insulinase family protein [Rhodanobacter thiooxydans]
MSCRKNACRLAVFTAILVATGNVAAADFPATPPAPGPAPQLSVPTPTTQTLANGLQVVSVRRGGLPLVTAQLIVRRGGEMDPPALAGLADLTANLLTKGAAGRSAPQIAAAAEALGGSLDAAAGWDESAVGITVTTPKLPQALGLLAEVVRQPDFSAEELKRAQAQALDDLRLTLSRPTALASLAASRGVFGAGAYGHSRGGTPASIARIGRADVQRLHAALYRPDNAILVLAGDITPAQAQQLAQASFGDWRKPTTPLPARPAGRAASQLPRMLLIDQRGAGQAGVVAAHAAPPRGDGDYYVGTLANAVLGGSYSARLNQEIRIKRGLSYGATSRLEPLRDAGLWLASAQTKNPSAAPVVELMLGEFKRLGDSRIGVDELAARKATLIGGYGRSLETTTGLAGQVGELAVYGVPLDEIGKYVARVQAVTPKQIEKYAKRHLAAGAGTVVVVGDAVLFAADIRKAHPQAALLQSTALDLDSPTLQPAGSRK